MADLFDVSVGGVGWHFTSHLVALAALFIACFAIAGYITFRKDSIPGDALKDHDVDVDDITGTTLNISGNATVGGNLINNYVRFMTEDWSSLTVSTQNDAACDAGFTMVAGTLYEAAWAGDQASAIVLPSAKVGDVIVFRLTAQADGTANLTFTCATGEYFAQQSIITATQNLGDLTLTPRTVGTTHTPTVATGTTGAIITVAANSDVWTISADATNNQTNIGAEFSFLCETAGRWRVGFKGSELGTGAINTTFTIA